ncbi:hypothetical protein [Streptomyces sp. CC224B]|uniref:hypothetical protein n=1 Tax=Streptomyces sp. CC224B TaxID=3044571 RepID=UPI0024A91CDB|nr:hypothetical protein [Streptomyces sp. CC224B]
MPKKQSTAAQRARRAARQGGKYTQALRTAEISSRDVTEPDDGFGSHVFDCARGTGLVGLPLRCEQGDM